MRRLFLGLTVLVSLGSVSARAQSLATIVGTVTDPSGAVVPSARVTVSNPLKGFVRHLETDSAGAYTAVGVPIGTYIITAEASGFAEAVRKNIAVSVGETLRVDFRLALGSGTQRVTIVGTVAHVQTETGTISSLITGKQITQLNLNGRNFTNLAVLIPGAAPGYGYNPFSVGVLADSGISFNGMPTQYNNWEIDGVNNTDQGAGGTANMIYPNIDSIAEERISTSTYDAQYGKNSGATIEIALKSGTDKFHGDLFEFDRNNAFDANNWFLNRTIAPPGGNAAAVPLRWNDYGFTLGGPVYVPRIYNGRKFKTYFFWSEEWKKESEGTVINAGVPTLRMRRGDFSECDPKTGNYNPVVASNCVLPINPATGALFPNDTVPIDPNAEALLSGLFPLPNNGVDTYTAAPSLPTYWREDLIRIDQHFGDKTSVFFHYINDAFKENFLPTLWVSAEYPTVETEWTSPSKSAVFNLTRSIRPNLLNEFMVGFSADVNTVNQTTGFASPAGSINKPASWSVSTLFPANATIPILPGVSVCGGLPFCANESTGYNYFFWGPVTQLKDNMAWTKGNHLLRFGGYLQRIHLNQTSDSGQSAQGFFTFSNSAPNSTGNALADMYLGRIASYQELGQVINGQPFGGYPLGHWREWDFEPYFQDDWRATRRLTLNIGMRYYLPTAYQDVRTPNLDSIFMPSLYNPAAEAQLSSSGNLIPSTGHTYLQYGNGLLECGVGQIRAGCLVPYRGSIAPRLGFAWDPTGSGKTAVRGGYGIFYDVSNGNEGGAGFFGNNPPDVGVPTVYYVNGYANISSAVAPLPPTSFSNESYYQKWPSVQQFSLGIEHQFPGNNLLSVSYVGDLGRHLERARNLNQVPVGAGIKNVPALAGTPGCDSTGNCNVQAILIQNLEPTIFFVPFRGYGTILNREWTAISNYNSLQVDFRHSVGHGLTLEAAYTWSHTLDNTFGLNNSNNVNDYDLSRWYADSNLDQPQMLVMNYVYDLPFFLHSSNVLARTFLGGWEFSGVTSFLSGNPISISCGIAGMSSGVGGAVMCNSLGPLKIDKGITDDPQFGPTPTWFNPTALGQIEISQLAANNEPGMFGYMGRNSLIGPGRNNWDLALLKNFRMPWINGESSSVQFRLETFNTFNHTQWSGVNASCGSETPPGTPCSGIVNNLGNGEVSSAWPAREIQFGLKFSF
jgi:hypothetical protein